MNKTKEQLMEIINKYEKVSGYRVCLICDKLIKKNRKLIIKESVSPYALKTIGAICSDCFDILKRNYRKDKFALSKGEKNG